MNFSWLSFRNGFMQRRQVMEKKTSVHEKINCTENDEFKFFYQFETVNKTFGVCFLGKKTAWFSSAFVWIFQWIPKYCYVDVHWVCHSQIVLPSHSESILCVCVFWSSCVQSLTTAYRSFAVSQNIWSLSSIAYFFFCFFCSSSSCVSGVSCEWVSECVWCFYPLRVNVCTCVLVCSFVYLFVRRSHYIYLSIYYTCISVLFILFRSRSQQHEI